MKRREFLGHTLKGVGAAYLGQPAWTLAADVSAPLKQGAADEVVLGSTGIRTSRLSIGTGTNGFGGRSQQSSLGLQGLADLLWNGYDLGVRFWDVADAYGTHPHARAALAKLPRERITITTKSWSRSARGIAADLERYRKELSTDYIDIFLLHCLTEGDWPQTLRGAMDVLSEARAQGKIRAHGVSCHSLEALRAAARTPWVQVDLARINPIGAHMDADPATVISVLREMKAAGKGVYGMKILAQGDMSKRVEEALRHALRLDCIDAFTIGISSRAELADIVRRLPAASA